MATFEVQEVQASSSVQTKTAQIGSSGLMLAQPTPVNSTYVTVEEMGVGPQHITRVAVAGLPITLGNTTAISFGSVGLITFPKGLVHIEAVAVKDFLFDYTDDAANVTPIAGTMGGDFSLGSTATSDSTLNSTDVNILASTSYDPFSTAISVASAINVILDGTSTAITCYLNAIVDDADVADGASDVVEIGTAAAPVYFYFKWSMLR